MSNVYSAATLTGKMCYLKSPIGTDVTRAMCLDYNDHTNKGVFMLRGGDCVMKYSIEIVSVASDQSPFSAPEPKPPVTARTIVDRIRKFFA
jgi:hypothetical protein